MRYVIEGTWSGYTSNQRRVAHRTVERSQKQAEAIKALGSITYTDGTALWLDVREAQPRERVQEIHGYDSLIRDCVRLGVNRVSDLSEKRKGA